MLRLVSPRVVGGLSRQLLGAAVSTSSSSSSPPPPLNSVNLGAVVQLIEAVKANPKAAETRWRSSVVWTKGFQATARIPGTPHTVLSDEPLALGGSGAAPNPVEIVLSALGQCLAVGYAAAATARGVELKSLRIDLAGDINIIPFLVLGEAEGSRHAGFRAVEVGVHLEAQPGSADAAVLQDIHEHVLATSPVGHTLQNPVPVKYQLHLK